MDKEQIILAILDELERIREAAVSATQTAIDAATNEETVPEHKYDTLALEASYLAHGQAVRVRECESDIEKFNRLTQINVGANSVIAVGALVELLDERENELYFFVGPCAGGVTVRYQAKVISLITPNAPLGLAMMGKNAGDEIELVISGKRIRYEIANIF